MQALDRVVFGEPSSRTYARPAQSKKTQVTDIEIPGGIIFPIWSDPSRVVKAWLAHRFTRDTLTNPVPPWLIPGEAVVRGHERNGSVRVRLCRD